MSEPPSGEQPLALHSQNGELISTGGCLAVVCRLPTDSCSDLASIDRECNRPPWTVKLFEQEFRHDYSRILGARIGGKLVAYLVYHLLFDEAHILNFGVRREARGQGIGRLLLTSALDEMGESGCRSVTLEVRRSNEVALGLYSSIGFEEIALRRAYYSDDQEDGIMLKLDLLEFGKRLVMPAAANL